MAINTGQDEFFDELETMTPSTREKYLNQKLAETIKHAYQNAHAIKEYLIRQASAPTRFAL